MTETTQPRKVTQDWIAEVSEGRSFLEVGGLWGTQNERISDASRAGAAELTMADITPEGHELWQAFLARVHGLGVEDVRCVSVDIMAPDAVARVGRHDVLHCSGVIYHLPDPFGLIQRLRALTFEYLIVVSMVIPERIETDAGTLTIEGGEALYVPGLDSHQLAVVQEHYRKINFPIGTFTNYNAEKWVQEDGTPRFGPWWWLFTPTFLRRMAESAGLEVVSDAPVTRGLSHGFLCRVPR